MLFRTTEGLRNPTDFSFLLCLDGGVAESWGVTGVLGGTSWEFLTKGWVRHLGAGLTLICCRTEHEQSALGQEGLQPVSSLLPTQLNSAHWATEEHDRKRESQPSQLRR